MAWTALAGYGGGISGRDLITAMVAGMECAERVQRCVGHVPRVRLGFHAPGLMGTFAATAAASRALDLPREQVVDALGHAGQQASGIVAVPHGGMGKRLLAGKAAQRGTLAALLASHGFTNVPNILECEYDGFPSTYTGGDAYNLEELIRGSGTEWRTMDAGFKMWACRAPIHPTLEALRTLQRDRGLQADDVAKVTVRLDDGAYKAPGFSWTPTTITSAQVNLHCCAAALLLEGDVFVRQFSDEHLANRHILDLTRRIETVLDDQMDALSSYQRRVRGIVALKNGETLEAIGETRGSPLNPVTRDDVIEKFLKMVSAILSEDDQDALLALCDRPEMLDGSAANLAAYLRRPPQPGADCGCRSPGIRSRVDEERW